MTIDKVITLPEGAHKRSSLCIALVGSREVDIEWAVQAMQIQFPISCTRSLMTFAHDNIDVARNIALHEWLKATNELKSDWIALLATGSTIRWDALIRCISENVSVAKIGECYVINRKVAEEVSTPHFVNGKWSSSYIDRSDLLYSAIVPNSQTSEVAVAGEGEDNTIIAMCIPTLGKTSLIWVTSAISLTPPLTLRGALILAKGHEVGEARQRLAEAALKMKPLPSYLLFWGDDNLPPHDGLTMLLDTMKTHNADAVAGLYHMKNFPPKIPLLWRNGVPGHLIAGKDFNMGDVIEVDGTGLDFVLFKTSALAKLPPLKFHTLTKWVEGQGLMMQTEDAFFWDRWREVHGKGPLVDTKCLVGHYNSRDGGIY